MIVETKSYDDVSELYTVIIEGKQYYLGFDRFNDTEIEIFDFVTIKYLPELSNVASADSVNIMAQLKVD